MADALAELVDELPRAGRMSFRRLTDGLVERLEVIVRFLALLELFKQGLVELDQPRTFGDIEVRWVAGDLVGDEALAMVESGASPYAVDRALQRFDHFVAILGVDQRHETVAREVRIGCGAELAARGLAVELVTALPGGDPATFMAGHGTVFLTEGASTALSMADRSAADTLSPDSLMKRSAPYTA